MTKKNRILRIGLLLFLAFAIVICALCQRLNVEHRHGVGVYPSAEDALTPLDEAAGTHLSVDSQAILERQTALQTWAKTHATAAAWLTIPGTRIDIPLIQEDTNAGALADAAGSSFSPAVLDCSNAADFSDSLTVILGTDGQACQSLGGLGQFRDSSYLSLHTDAFLITETQVLRIQIRQPASLAAQALMDLLLQDDKQESEFADLAEQLSCSGRSGRMVVLAAEDESGGSMTVLLGTIVEESD